MTPLPRMIIPMVRNTTNAVNNEKLATKAEQFLELVLPAFSTRWYNVILTVMKRIQNAVKYCNSPTRQCKIDSVDIHVTLGGVRAVIEISQCRLTNDCSKVFDSMDILGPREARECRYELVPRLLACPSKAVRRRFKEQARIGVRITPTGIRYLDVVQTPDVSRKPAPKVTKNVCPEYIPAHSLDRV